MKYSSKTEPKKLIAEIEKAFSNNERVNIRKTWSSLARFVLQAADGPFVDQTTAKSKGSLNNQEVYDSTAAAACRDLASAMHSTLTNPSMLWSKLRFQNEALNNSKNVVLWLDKSTEILHQFLNDSNFDTQIGMSYQHVTGLATMVFYQELKYNESGTFTGFNHQALHLGNVAFCTNAEGQVDNLYRRLELTSKQAYEMFPDHPYFEEEAAKGEKNADIVVWHSIVPRDEKEVKINPLGRAIPTARPYVGLYICSKTHKVLKEEGYYEQPFFVVRWSVRPGEDYGYGPGHTALPDIKTINKVRKDHLQAAAKAIAPPIISTQRNIINGDFRANGITYVRDLEAFKELGSNPRVDIAKDIMEDLKNSIRACFYIDKLMLPPRTETGEMSAYEVSQRLEQMQQILGPVVSRFNSEFLAPFVLRTLKVLLREGKLPQLPPELENVQDVELQISFVNSLARSQQMSELRNIQTWVQETAMMAQIKPEILDNIDFDEVLYYQSKIRGIPEQMLKDVKAVQKERQQRQQQMQQQQMLAAGEQVANIAGAMPNGQK